MTLMSKRPFFEKLWSRMAQHGDFPTLQFCIDNIFKTLSSDISVGEMASTVLSDFSLSQKVIRLANSAMYRSFGGEVSTVSRAILVLGVDAISHLSLGVQLIDYFSGVAPNRPQALKALKQALLAGEITRALSNAQGINQGEEAVVCTLMHNLSRLLLVFYFPEEWERIQSLCNGDPSQESEACKEILGVTLEQVAEAAAVRWRLPAVIASSMTGARLTEESALESHADWLGAIAQASTHASALATLDDGEARVLDYLSAHAAVLGLRPPEIETAVLRARALNASISKSEAVEQRDMLKPGDGKPKDAHKRLVQGLLEIRSEGAELSVSQLAPLVLESTMRSLNFSRCFLMLLNPAAKRFGARIGFGEGVREKLGLLAFEEGFVPDIFHFAAIAKKPLLIEDSFDDDIAHRIPRWYRDAMPDAKSVLLSSVKVRGRCVAIVCGDWGATPCTGGLTTEELEAVDLMTAEIGSAFLRMAEGR
jgi:HD-like signal output (HDOD) protein